MYPTLLRNEDENSQNILGFAITGYCSGKDKAWEVIAYLLNQDSMVTERTLGVINAASADKEEAKKKDRDMRKQQVRDLIEEREAFFQAHMDEFYDCPDKPLYKANSSCIIS